MPQNYPSYDTWSLWTTASVTTTASANTMTWGAWNSVTCSASTSTSWANTWEPPPPPTPEELERQRQERERLDAQRRENITRRQAAERRAAELLEALLSEEQLAEWRAHGRFLVRSQSGRRYCIHRGRQHNVFLVDDDGRRLVEYCGHVRDHVPDADNVLAQKLLLEHDEEAFLSIANRWRLADHPLADEALAVPRQVGTGSRIAVPA